MVSEATLAGAPGPSDDGAAAALSTGAARVWLCGDAALSRTLADLMRTAGHRTHTDAGHPDAGTADALAEAGMHAALAALGGLDAMVYVQSGATAAGPDSADVLALTQAQAGGFLARAREAVRAMAAARTPGNLVCICDIAGVAGRAGRAAAATASGALLGMTRALAKELGRQQIAVNAIACGPLAAAAHDTPTLTPAERELFAAMGLGAPVEPAELARTLGLLVSGGHGMTGQVLRLDHGLVI